MGVCKLWLSVASIIKFADSEVEIIYVPSSLVYTWLSYFYC